MRGLLCVTLATLGLLLANLAVAPVLGMETQGAETAANPTLAVSADLAFHNEPVESANVNPHWRSVRTYPLTQPLERPLRVYIEPGNKAHGYLARYNKAVVDGLDLWSEALDGRLQVVYVNSPRHADIKIQWLTTFREPDVGGDALINIGSSVIRIRTAGIPPSDVEANILHELGHALGIQGHSPYAGDIMAGRRRWARGSSYTPKLSIRDRQAIQRLYSPQWQPGEDLYQPGILAQKR